MRIFDNLLDPRFSAHTMPLLGVMILLALPGLLKNARSQGGLLVVLLAIGFATGLLRIPIAGAGTWSLSVIPALVVLAGWRTAVAAAAMYALLDIGMDGSEQGAGINFLLNGLVMPTVALISYRGFLHRIGTDIKAIPAALGAWFSVMAVAVMAAMFVPFMGRALWGVFAPAISTAALWTGAIEGLFTGVLVACAEAWRRSPGLPRQVEPASDEVVTSSKKP